MYVTWYYEKSVICRFSHGKIILLNCVVDEEQLLRIPISALNCVLSYPVYGIILICF